MEGGVDAACFCDDVIWECIKISGLELRRFAPREDIGDDRVLSLQCGECLLVGLILTGLGFLRLIRKA